MTGAIPFLDDLSAYLRAQRHRPSPKVLCYFFATRTGTAHRISARSEPPGSRFSTSKTALLPQVAQKSGSEASRSILLTSSLTLWNPALEIIPLRSIISNVLPLKNTFVKMPLKYDANSIGNRLLAYTGIIPEINLPNRVQLATKLEHFVGSLPKIPGRFS